jgi:hypothetical protein
MSDNDSDHRRKENRRIQIKVPEYLKAVSEDVWQDLEDYLYDGFLTSSAYLFDKTFVFKTLNHHEVQYISFLRPLKKAPSQVRLNFQAAFIAHSIFILDGENTLYKRPEHIGKLVKLIGKIPPKIQEEMIYNLSALNSKAIRLHPLIEAYVHENRSRYKWLQVENITVHSPLATGIAGTDELGMNYCQQTWTSLNRILDEKERMERDWVNAKFIGSCFAGKGIRQIDERDKMQKEKERIELEEKKMKVLYTYLNRKAGKTEQEELESKVQLPDGRMASVHKKFQAESVEELAEQLSASLSGEKDHHDMVVEAKLKQNEKRKAIIDDYYRKIYTATVSQSPTIASTKSTEGTSRIIGGKEEANKLLAKIQFDRLKRMDEMRKQLPEDLQNSDRNSIIDKKKTT